MDPAVLGIEDTGIKAGVIKVANVNGAGNTFEMAGENSTPYDTFSSGQFEVLTFGTTLNIATGLSASGGEAEFVPVTTIHDAVAKRSRRQNLKTACFRSPTTREN